MTSSRMLVIAITACGACVEDVPTMYETATARMDTSVAPPDDHIPVDLGHYRWELVEAPVGHKVDGLSATTAAVTITPPVRGIYAFNRWFVGQASEQLSYHVVLTVDGATPTAVIAGPTSVAIGAATVLDGSSSSSPEGLALTFQWRLAIRPASSATDVVGVANTTTTVVPDVAGSYVVQLRVFDGELWSTPASTTLIAR